MVSMLSEEGRAKAGVYEYVIDTVDELSDVPTDVHVGSVVYCIENSKKYMLNNSGTYVEVNFKKGGSGGEAKLGTKEINENGIYQASDFDLDGWSEVDVSVPVGVFPSGTSSITANGIYDITNFASVDVNVSGGGGGTDVEDGIIMRTISGSYTNSRVTEVGSYAFYSCQSLTAVSFPNVTEINQDAFGYAKLNSISFPSAVSIGSRAFIYCQELSSSIYFPNVTSVGESVFANCQFVSVDFPKLTKVGTAMFLNCYMMTSMSLPSVTAIYASGFARCASLSIADFPNVTTISAYAFASCYSLATISFPSATSIGSFAFQECSKLASAIFPNVTKIFASAFRFCAALSMASFPLLASIPGNAFYGCSQFSNLYLLGSSMTTLTVSTAFTNTPFAISTSTASIFVPASLYDAYTSASNWSYFTSRFVSLTNAEIEALG